MMAKDHLKPEKLTTRHPVGWGCLLWPFGTPFYGLLWGHYRAQLSGNTWVFGQNAPGTVFEGLCMGYPLVHVLQLRVAHAPRYPVIKVEKKNWPVRVFFT